MAVCLSAAAQPATRKKPVPDSTKVYTYVERMPLYPGGGMSALKADLLREFRAASPTAGCAVPTFPIYVSLTVGPSGSIYGVKSINNSPSPSVTKKPGGPDGQGQQSASRSLQQLPVACEQALVEAAKRLSHPRPGTQNGRRVAVNFLFRLN